ncbi:DNA-binding protein [Caballeronia sp. INSB1]|uniref:DNA-binding protein n=1 Tax=Caballeronia sp. INSB1 TaxID=2921751 RepID=UPI002032D783|nr:DNA-binding protein [Caballeronia sp. INSB1]
MTVDTKEFADCNEVAELLRIKPNSVRTRLYRTGSLWGIEPMKAPNGRNLFPVAAVRGLIRDRKGVC